MELIKKTLTGMLFGCTITVAIAQKSPPIPEAQFLKGSIVTANHDTIYCFVMERDLRETPNAIYKIKLTDKKTLKVKKDEYLRVQMGRTVYEKLSVSDSTDLGQGYLKSDRILKLVCNGYIKLYSDIHYNGGNPMYGQYESFHIKKGNGSLLKINRIGFKSMLKSELSGMPDCKSRIDDSKFNFSDIPELIKAYNLWYLNK